MQDIVRASKGATARVAIPVIRHGSESVGCVVVQVTKAWKTGSLQQLLPALVFGLLDEALDLLRTCARGDEQRVGHINDDQVIDAK